MIKVTNVLKVLYTKYSVMEFNESDVLVVKLRYYNTEKPRNA